MQNKPRAISDDVRTKHHALATTRSVRSRLADWQARAAGIAARADVIGRGRQFPGLADDLRALKAEVEAASLAFEEGRAGLPAKVAASSYLVDMDRAFANLKSRLARIDLSVH